MYSLVWNAFRSLNDKKLTGTFPEEKPSGKLASLALSLLLSYFMTAVVKALEMCLKLSPKCLAKVPHLHPFLRHCPGWC